MQYTVSIVETPKLGVSTTQMQLSETGQTAKKYWLEIPDHFPFVVLDEFVIMPNHIHGIMGLNNIVNNNDGNKNVETPKLGVSTWKNGCLGVIINQYKRICTINIRKNNNLFAWQSRYYDHIVRDENSLNRVREYIRNNPINWKNDRNNFDDVSV